MSEFGTLDRRESIGTISENDERFHELSKEVSEEGGSNSPSESESARMPSRPHLNQLKLIFMLNLPQPMKKHFLV